MTALSADRENNRELNGSREADLSFEVDAGQQIFQGAIVVIDSVDELAKPGVTATTLTAVGVARDQADNTGGADGAISVEVKQGTFRFDNNGDTISHNDIGATCYIVDDQTVDLTDGGASRSPAGVIVDVEGIVGGTVGQVWVKVGPGVQPA